MKWDGQRESSQIEDRRGSGGGGRGGGGIRVGGGRGVGLGTIAVALVAGWIFGINPGRTHATAPTGTVCGRPI